jgi:hypothetical protein
VVRRQGAYGLRLVEGLDELLVPLPPGLEWPPVAVSVALRRPRAGRLRVGTRTAEIPLLHGDRAIASRTARSATLETALDADDGRLLHPFLAVVAVVFAWWDGRLAFHGGGFADPGGGAWALVGARGSGKSSTLAALATRGVPVLADDLLVVEHGTVLASPRCIDLRPDAASAIGVDASCRRVRAGERLRLPLQGSVPIAPLRGWIFLEWSKHLEVRRVGAAERLERINACRNTIGTRGPSLLDIAGLEAWELRRPRNRTSLEPAVHRILQLVGG